MAWHTSSLKLKTNLKLIHKLSIKTLLDRISFKIIPLYIVEDPKVYEISNGKQIEQFPDLFENLTMKFAPFLWLVPALAHAVLWFLLAEKSEDQSTKITPEVDRNGSRKKSWFQSNIWNYSLPSVEFSVEVVQLLFEGPRYEQLYASPSLCYKKPQRYSHNFFLFSSFFSFS